jgi:hypothetical protein
MLLRLLLHQPKPLLHKGKLLKVQLRP